jgi:mannose/fructose/N-acetylgalactosamine-specific phosphotransferase system component IID
MYLVAIAWMYVVLMMAVAEATSSTGTVLGALITFVLYGVLPLSIIIYLMRSPQRRAQRRAQEQQELAQPAADSAAPDASGHAATDAVAPMRKEN